MYGNQHGFFGRIIAITLYGVFQWLEAKSFWNFRNWRIPGELRR